MPKNLLDRVYYKLTNEQTLAGMEELFQGLHEIRFNSATKEWSEIIDSTLLTHPVRQIIHADPITSRSFRKPRGYPGDAVLLDMIYGHESVNYNDVSEIGKSIHKFTANNMAARAVRHRRKLLARLIDRIALKRSKPKILSVACGHLREVELSQAIRTQALGEFVALDQDLKSLDVVKQEYFRYGVTALDHSVSDIIRKKFTSTGFDLIYSAGLFDYLDRKVARKLTLRLFDMLAGGGILLLTNFLPDISAVGYMESYMAWNLIYRDEPEMMELVKSIPRKKIDRMEVFVEKQENIVFLQVHKIKPTH